MTKRLHREHPRSPLIVPRILNDDELAFVTTAPDPNMPPGHATSAIRIDISRFAPRVEAVLAAYPDPDTEDAAAWRGVVLAEDRAAVQATMELAAFLTSVFGSSLGPMDATAANLRTLTGLLSGFLGFLEEMAADEGGGDGAG